MVKRYGSIEIRTNNEGTQDIKRHKMLCSIEFYGAMPACQAERNDIYKINIIMRRLY